MTEQTTHHYAEAPCPHCGGRVIVWRTGCRCEGCGRKTVRTEVYSRIVGYLRPVQNWAAHKQQEFRDRRTYEVPAREEMGDG